MKLKVQSGKKKGRGKEVIIMANKVSIVGPGGISRNIGFGTMGGVRAPKRQYQFSYDRPTMSVTSPQNDAGAPPEVATPAEQNLIANSLGRLGRILGAEALNYARQGGFRRMYDAWQNSTFNNSANPNQADATTMTEAPAGVSGDSDDIGYSPGSRTSITMAIPNVYADGTPIRMDQEVQAGASTAETSMQTAQMPSAAVGTQAGLAPVETGAGTEPVITATTGTQVAFPSPILIGDDGSPSLNMASANSSDSFRSALDSLPPSTQINSTYVQTDPDAEQIRTLAEVATVTELNMALGELLQEAQQVASNYSLNAEQERAAHAQTLNSMAQLVDTLVGDSRWRGLIPTELPPVEQMNYIFQLVNSRDPELRQFIKERAGLVERMQPVADASAQTYRLNRRNIGTNTAYDTTSLIPARRRMSATGMAPTIVDVQPRVKRERYEGPSEPLPTRRSTRSRRGRK